LPSCIGTIGPNLSRAALAGTAFLAKPYTAESLLVLVRRTLDTPAV